MCGGGDDPFSGAGLVAGFSASDLVEITLIGAPLLGFAVSIAAGIVLMQGRARQINIAALLLGLLCLAIGFGLFQFTLGGFYIRNHADIAALGFFIAFFLIYARHTYFPTPLKWVNRPATLGFVCSLICAALLVFNVV